VLKVADGIVMYNWYAIAAGDEAKFCFEDFRGRRNSWVDGHDALLLKMCWLLEPGRLGGLLVSCLRTAAPMAWLLSTASLTSRNVNVILGSQCPGFLACQED
jgi:hypothetical protein